MAADLEKKFNTAVEIVQNLPKDGAVVITNDEKLVFYGLFKQATVGPCNTVRPGIFSIIERYKWDAWNKNCKMEKDQAMKKYLEVLLEKIAEVEKTHDVKQWLSGDLFDIMAPKFAIIGKYYGQEEEKHEEEEEEAEGPLSANENTPMLSDTEYCDAEEDEGHSRLSSYDLQETPPAKPRVDLNGYCERVEVELKTISEQIERLSSAVEQRHASLVNIFKKATVYMFVPKGISWTTIFFFIVWPFIAHLIMKYLKRLPSH